MTNIGCETCAHQQTCKYVEKLRRTALLVAELANRTFAHPYAVSDHAREAEELMSRWCRHYTETPPH